jgi:hypothetical protein
VTSAPPMLECGLLACATDVMSLILIDIRDLRPLDSFGILLTSNGRRWFPSLRTIVKRKWIALSHSWAWFWSNIQTRVPWIHLGCSWPTMGGNVCQAQGIPPKTRGLPRSMTLQRGSFTWFLGYDTAQQTWWELHSVRIARLDLIGFVWDSHDHQWEDMFAKLEGYHQCHGDCLVPTNYKEDPSLGMWVSTQRKKRHELDPTRRESKAPVDRIRVAGQTWTTSVGREKQKKRTQS